MVPKLRFSFTSVLSPYKLGVLTKWSSGGTPSKDNKSYWDGDISWFTAASMKDNKLSVSPTKISDLGLANGSRLANKNDILLLVRGSMLFNKIPVGALLNDAAFNQDVKAIKCLEKFNHRFALQWFLSKESHLLGMVTGTGIGAGKLDTSDLQNLDVYLPDDVEQSKIADFLSSVDEKITSLNKQYDLLSQYKKGMMQKIFSQEMRFKDENGKEFPEWNRKFIGNILTIGSGRDYKHLNAGNVPVFGTGGFMTMVDQYLFEGETVCIGRKGTIDKPFYYNGKIWTVDTLFYTHEFKGAHPKFVYQLFLTINWKEYNEASGVPSLSKNTIEKIEVNIPCLSEQNKISSFLSTLDDKIAAKKAELDKLKSWKQGLLQQMFV